MRRSRALTTAVALVAVAATTAFACEPVEPAEAWENTTFEGFEVHAFVPDDPVGLVFLFHGSNGSADVATRVETVDVLNELTGRGYAFVATESTLRTGNRRWDVTDPSPVTNPDLARLARLHTELVATTAVDDHTPLLAVGMSNGARMATLFGHAFAEAGHPVAAVAPVNGTVAQPVRRGG